MAKIDPDKLFPGEDYVLMAILEQRDESESDVFVYSVRKGQKFLRSQIASKKYGIGPGEQIGIIQRLAKIGIINADWAIWVGEKFVLANEREWAQDKFQMEKFEQEVFGIEPEPICFINLSHKEMGEIYNSAIKRYTAQLYFSGENARFIVACDNGERYYVSGPNDGSRQFKIISYVMDDKNIGRIITKDELRENNIRINDNEYIASQVFRNNDAINRTLSPFFTVKTESIQAKRTALLTLAQLDTIKDASI